MNYSDYTNTGGHPLQLDDLEFDQIATREALFDLARGLGQTESRFIVWGCNVNTINITSGNLVVGKQFEVSEGAVFWDGELWHFGGGITPTTSNNFAYPVLRQNTSIAPPSPVAYNSGALVNVHKVRELSLTISTSLTPAPQDFDLSSPRVPEIMRDAIAAVTETDPWHVVGSPGEPSYQNGWQGDVDLPFQFKRDFVTNQVYFRGRITNANTNALSTVTVLPPEVRPPATTIQPAGNYYLPGGIIQLRIFDNGTMRLGDDVSIYNNSPVTIHLDNISWFLS